MMPSACTKPDQKASGEACDPINKAINVVDKKVRNLEKRKGKLDGYREKLNSGEGLNEDQREAIGKYDGVVQNLEFARDLQKQFLSIHADAEKQNRRQQKKVKLERQSQDMSKVRELLQLQGLLDNMGSDTVRSDFLSGNNGATVLTEDNLNQLDELYKLISPTREGETSYADQLNAASEHLTFFLDSKDKEVIGTTYKDLREMVCKVHECGYFDRVAAAAEEEEEAEAVEEEGAAAAAPAEEEPVVEDAEAAELQPEIEFGSPEAVAPVLETSEIPPELAPQQQELEPQQTHPAMATAPHSAPEPTSALSQEQEEAAAAVAAAQQQAYEEQESFFSTEPAFSRQRPVQEILSSVQGTYDFLQESHVDMDSPAHLDPAVVAAHPITNTMSQQQTDNSMTSHAAYQSNMLGTEDQSSQQQHQYQSSGSQYQQNTQYPPQSTTHVSQPSAVEQQQQQQTLQQQAEHSQQSSVQQSDSQYAEHGTVRDTHSSGAYGMDSTYKTEHQNYGQNLISQSLQTTAQQQQQQQQHSYADQTSSLASQISSHTMEQSLGIAAAAVAAEAASGPQPIPLPSQVLPGQSLSTRQAYSSAAEGTQGYDGSQGYSSATESSQSYVTATDNSQASQSNSDSSEQEKKAFLNPNADMFRPAAAYTQQPEVTMAQQEAVYSQGGAASSGSGSAAGQHEPKAYNQAASQQAFQQQSDYQSSNYSNFDQGSGGFRGSRYTANNRGPRPDNQQQGMTRTGSGSRDSTGGTRSSGGRGGSTSASTGMINNGYPRTGRGGAPYNSGANRGGYNNGNRGGGGGSGGNRGNTYQGFPARSDYRPEGGYQGYGNQGNTFSSTRGGSTGGAPRGNTRGGTAGGMRGGGPPRTNQMRTNTQGGAGSGGYNRAGYGRPGSAGSSMPHAAS